MLEETLLGAIVSRACQAGQIEQNRDLGSRFQSLWREKDVYGHIRISTGRLVLQLEQLASK